MVIHWHDMFIKEGEWSDRMPLSTEKDFCPCIWGNNFCLSSIKSIYLLPPFKSWLLLSPHKDLWWCVLLGFSYGLICTTVSLGVVLSNWKRWLEPLQIANREHSSVRRADGIELRIVFTTNKAEVNSQTTIGLIHTINLSRQPQLNEKYFLNIF